MGIKHAFTSTKDDGDDSTLVKPSDWNADHTDVGQFVAGWDGGGSAITADTWVDVIAKDDCTITGWTMTADQSGSAQVDIWKDTYANFPPTVADTITASAKPSLTAATKDTSTTLTGWTTAVTAGDILRFYLDSASAVTRLLLVVAYTRP